MSQFVRGQDGYFLNILMQVPAEQVAYIHVLTASERPGWFTYGAQIIKSVI